MSNTFSIKLYKKYINKSKNIIFRDKISKKEETIELDENGFNINGYFRYGYDRYGYNINRLGIDGVDRNNININGIIGSIMKYPDEDIKYKKVLMVNYMTSMDLMKMDLI